ncbi:MAG TPA: hypothetical protein VL443_24935 [Cyclobacteriaceae bacterium]|nr:hypothetical protein [Cyclobacteriaceae bacterium]
MATKKDIRLYGKYITVGDLIIDTPTGICADGINKLMYNRISKTFPGLREDAVIWVDGKKLGPFCEFRLLNVTETTPWHISSATVKPIPGTRMDGVYTENSYGGFLYLIQGLKNIRIDGGNDDNYPGLTAFPKDRIFLKGSFGIGATSTGIYRGYHAFSIGVLDGGSIYIESIEGEHGFSVLRLEGGGYDWIASVEIKNCYVHDSNSEGMYIGATHAPPLAKIKDLKISNIICARTGSESLQMQHLIGNSHVNNVSIYAPDTGFLKQFGQGQDTAIQLSADQGECLLENIVVDSWGSHGINLFGSDAYPADSTSTTTIRNVLFNDGRGQAIYPHRSCRHGMKWHFEDIYIRRPTNEYFLKENAVKPNYSICSNEGTDSISFDRITYDETLSRLFQDTSLERSVSKKKAELPPIEYVNAGFYEPASKIKVWHPYYAYYLSGVVKLPTHWNVGDIAEDMEPGSLPVFCKCIAAHDSLDTRPKNSSNYMILSWDENGVRNDQPNWNKNSVQRSYPPDDLRVLQNSFYGNLNIGFVETNSPSPKRKRRGSRK